MIFLWHAYEKKLESQVLSYSFIDVDQITPLIYLVLMTEN